MRIKKREKVQIVVFFEIQSELKLLLLQTNQKRGSFWQNVTGGVDGNESIEEAAQREVLEEIGLFPHKLIKLDLTFNFIDQWNTEVSESTFYCLFSEKDVSKIHLDQNEHQDFRISSIKEVNHESFKYKSNFETFKKSLSIIKYGSRF